MGCDIYSTAILPTDSLYLIVLPLTMEHIRNKYVYNDIDSAKKEIRLLKLLPGSRDSKVVGELIHTSLGKQPEYDALSYMWGDAVVTVPIQLVDNDDFQVTVNLEKALRDLRLEDKILTLWVDAICINQHNIAERNAQIGFMPTIYEKAATVRIWLDLEIDPASPAFAKLASLHDQSSPDDLGDDPQFWAPVWDIRKNRYWKRLWVQQEIARSRNLVIHCRRDPISSYFLARVAVLTRKKNYKWIDQGAWEDISLFPTIDSESRLTHTQPPPRRHENLLLALYHCRALKTSDARDSVYGVLGLAENYKDGDIIIDYSFPLTMVYCKVPEFIFQRYKSLGFISFAGFGESESELELPSWVPEWRNPVGCAPKVHPDKLIAEKPTPSTVAQLPVMSTLRGILNVHGFRVDRIADLYNDFIPTSFIDRECFENWKKIMKRAVSLEATTALKAILSFDSVASVDKNPGIRSALEIVEAFLRTLLEDGFDGFVRPIAALWGNIESFLEDGALHTPLFLQEPYINDWVSFLSILMVRVSKKLFLLTEKGTMGLAPKASKPGDEIWILFRCPTLTVLRPKNDHYIVVGWAYLHQHMECEMMQGWPEIVEEGDQFGEYTIKAITLH
jgi:hypothetical protein